MVSCSILSSLRASHFIRIQKAIKSQYTIYYFPESFPLEIHCPTSNSSVSLPLYSRELPILSSSDALISISKYPPSTPSIPPFPMAAQQDTWTCCLCGSTNVIDLTTRCPIPPCPHKMCTYCPRGPPPRTLGPPGSLFPSSGYRPSPSPSPFYQSTSMTYTTSAIPTQLPIQYSHPSSAPLRHASLASPQLSRQSSNNSGITGGVSSYRQYSQHPSGVMGGNGRISSARDGGGGGRSGVGFPRPPTHGWWRCCQDGHVNNPDLCPVMCVTDGHRKCSKCVNL